jgi:hypothetical protein
VGLTGGPIYSSVLFFYYCLFCLPPRTGSLQNRQTIQHFTHNNNMTHNSNITHISSNPQYSFRQVKQVRQLYSSWQAKQKPKLRQVKVKNDYSTVSLLLGLPVGFKRVSTKSYPCPPPCDPEPPWKTCKRTCLECEMDVLGLWSSKVNIWNWLLHNYVCLTVGDVKVVGRSGACPLGGDPHSSSGACPPCGDPHDDGGGQ